MQDRLAMIDGALQRMRRLWSPTTSGRAPRGEAASIDLSTVLVVHTIGGSEGGLAVDEIAERLGVAAATASRLVDRAVLAGFVQKATAPGDARRLMLTLTQEGIELRALSFAYRLEYLRGVLRDWAEEDISTFARLLARFGDTVHANPPVPPPTP